MVWFIYIQAWTFLITFTVAPLSSPHSVAMNNGYAEYWRPASRLKAGRTLQSSSPVALMFGCVPPWLSCVTRKSLPPLHVQYLIWLWKFWTPKYRKIKAWCWREFVSWTGERKYNLVINNKTRGFGQVIEWCLRQEKLEMAPINWEPFTHVLQDTECWKKLVERGTTAGFILTSVQHFKKLQNMEDPQFSAVCGNLTCVCICYG